MNFSSFEPRLLVLALLFLLGTSCNPSPRQTDQVAAGKKAVTPKAAKPTAAAASDQSTSLPTPPTRIDQYLTPRGTTPQTTPIHFNNRPTHPNVLLIVMDATNVRHLSAFGYHRDTTPNLSKLAKQGIVFTNYVSNAPWTRPSYTTIITGLPKARHQVELYNRDLPGTIRPAASRFKKAGYLTAGFVGNPLMRGDWGFDRGYDHYTDTITVDRAFPPDSWLARPASEWLERQDTDTPVFVSMFMTAPHTPYRPIESARHFVKPFPKGAVVEYPFREYPESWPDLKQKATLAAYDDEIRFADQQIGRMVTVLEKTNRLNNTIIAVTADHGEMLGEHNHYQHTYHMWEQTLRVPLLVVVPWADQHGIEVTRPYTHMDLLPSLLQMAGIQDTSDLPGRNLVSDLGNLNANRSRTIYSQYNAHGIRRQAIRRNGYKLIHHHKVNPSSLGRINVLHGDLPHAPVEQLTSLAIDKERFELYNLSSDPKEQHDLFSQCDHLPICNLLKTALNEQLKADTSDAAPRPLSEEMTQALKAAGYITQ